MADKKKTSKSKEKDIILKDPAAGIIQTPLEEVMHQSMIPYAEYVILERALPRVEDGLKPVQRRILYSMWDLGMLPDKPYRKCARIVGECLGKYHPHGDTSVYDALVRMAQPFSMRGLLVDGHGNFGSIDGDSAAAMRYTEARLAPLSMRMLEDIEKNTVSFHLNFDDTLKEPDMLPARYPNLLVNGASGIAVGIATNIPPHNLTEVIMGVIAQIDRPEITTKELMNYIPGPDFPTGGVLLETDELEKAYETGRGKLTLRARVDIEKGKAGRNLLVISEIPYQVSKSNMLEKILKISEEKKNILGGIYDIRDESDRNGIRAVVELKKDVDPEQVLGYLYKYSDLQVTFGVNMVAIAQGKPVQMGLKEIIDHFIVHQKNVVTRRTAYDLEQSKARAHILEGLMVAVDNLDEVIALIRGSKNPKEAKEKLMATFDLSEVQAQAILDMRLQRLTNLEILALRKEYEEILKRIAELESILKSEKKLLKVIKKELEEIADEFPQERLTMMKNEEEALAIPDSEPIVIEEATIVYTHGGYLKRVHPKNYEKWYKADEVIENVDDMPKYVLHTDTSQQLLFFTNLGNCYNYSVSALSETSRPKERGLLLSGILAGLDHNENLVALFAAHSDQISSLPPFIFYTKKGMVKKSLAEEYAIKRQKFIATQLKGKDELLSVAAEKQGEDILLITRNGQSIRFLLDSVPTTGRATGGVIGIQLETGDEVVWADQIGKENEILITSERGSMKRIPEVDFDPQGRNGKGVRLFTFNKNGSNGTYVAGALKLGQEPSTIVIKQKTSPITILSSAEVLMQGKTERGKPYVMALMEDVVTDILAVLITE